MRIVAAGATAMLVAATLTGCVTTGCSISWHDYSRPQELFRDADLVIVGEIGPVDGEVRAESGTGVGHVVSVETVFKGSSPQQIIAAVAGDGCEPPRAIDPLEGGESLLLFLKSEDGGWRTLTPFAGYLPWDPSRMPFARTLAEPVESRR